MAGGRRQTWTDAEQLDDLGQHLPAHHVDHDLEAGFDVGVRRRCRDPVSKPQLRHRLVGGIGRHLRAPGGDDPPKRIPVEVHATLESTRKQRRDRRLPCGLRTGDENDASHGPQNIGACPCRSRPRTGQLLLI